MVSALFCKTPGVGGTPETAIPRVTHTNTRNPFPLMRLLHGSLDAPGEGLSLPDSPHVPACGVHPDRVGASQRRPSSFPSLPFIRSTHDSRFPTHFLRLLPP